MNNDRQAFERTMTEGGVPSETASKLGSLLRPAVRLEVVPAGDSMIPPGASKLGGFPDVTSGFEWPKWKAQPLGFLGQIKLEDITGFECCDLLSRTGLLSFYYEQNQETWGFDPKDRGSWRVLYEETTTGLRAAERPQGLADEAIYRSGGLKMQGTVTLPATDALAVADLGLSDVEANIYDQVLDQIEEQTPEHTRHQLFGHPDPMQGEMQTECQLASNGIYVGDPSGFENPRVPDLMKEVRTWRMVLQIDSDDALEMMWGDTGRLYFWMTDDALRSRAFDDAWMVLQCG